MEKEKFGSLISKLRKQKGLTQKELGEKLHTTDKSVSRWENNTGFPNTDMLYSISKYFNISFYKLLKLRAECGNGDASEETIKRFLKEMKKNKRTKAILVFASLLLLVMTFVTIYLAVHNRFKVYKVGYENDDFYTTEGVYIETKVKDTLSLNSIKIRDVEIKNTDTVSVDLFYKENGKEYILKNFSNLDYILYTNFQSYIPIDDLSVYADDLYIRVTIIDKNNNVKEYESKLIFVLDFSNSKIFYKEDTETLDSNIINLTSEEIIKILVKNDFKEVTPKQYAKINKKYEINFWTSSNRIYLNYEKDNIRYKYNYYLNSSKLEVVVLNENNIEIENYTYNASKDKVTECVTGSCNSYQEAMDILNENILNLLQK